jgi:CBS domain-containing protein
MADNRPQETEQQDVQGQEGVRERGRVTGAAARQAGAAVGSAIQGGREGARIGLDMAEQGADATREGLRRGAEATAESLRRGGEAGARSVWHGSEAAAEGLLRSGRSIAAGERQFAQEAADRFEELGRRMAMAVQDTAEGLRTWMTMPNLATGGLQEVQHGLASLVEGVVRTNLRATQELFRLADPAAVVELQRRFAREYLDVLMAGSASFVRAARRTADQALQPLEQQIERRRAGGGDGRKVSDVMSRNVRVIGPDDTVQQAARLMREEDAGVLPVGEGDRLVGMVTDRDVTVRLAAEGKDAARTRVREVMTPEVRYVFEDEHIGHVVDNMADQQIRRLPVVNRDKRLVGIISLGDVAETHPDAPFVGRAMSGIAREGGQHTQTAA